MGKETTRLRRTFTPQFKKDALRLVIEEGKSITEVATHLGIARSLPGENSSPRSLRPRCFPATVG